MSELERPSDMHRRHLLRARVAALEAFRDSMYDARNILPAYPTREPRA